MDLAIRDRLIDRWRRYFGEEPLPLALFYTDRETDGPLVAASREWRCLVSGARWLVLVALIGAAGCAWRVDATRATGLCKGRAVDVYEVRDQGRSSSWMAACKSSIAHYRCAYVHGLSEVTCEYRPICGNDRHQDTRRARFRR